MFAFGAYRSLGSTEHGSGPKADTSLTVRSWHEIHRGYPYEPRSREEQPMSVQPNDQMVPATASPAEFWVEMWIGSQKEGKMSES